MAEILTTPLTVLHVVACLFLMLIVLIQPGKSGGMGALAGSGAQQVFGGRGAGNFLTKTTWITATTFFATSMTLAYFGSSTDDSLQLRNAKKAEAAVFVPPTPAPPTPAPSPAAPASAAPASPEPTPGTPAAPEPASEGPVSSDLGSTVPESPEPAPKPSP